MKKLFTSFFTTAVIQAMNIATGVLAARMLLPEGRGELAAILLWPSLIAAIGGLSLDQSVAYHGATKKEETGAFLNAALMVGTVLALLSVAVGLMVVPHVFEGQRPEVQTDAYLYLLIIPLSITNLLFMGCLQGNLRFGAWNLLRATPATIYLLGILLFLAAGEISVRLFVLASLGAGTVTLLVALSLEFSRSRTFRRPRWEHVKTLVRYAAGVHVAALIAIIAGRLDQAFISVYLDPSDLGFYVVAMTVAGGIGLISSTISPIAFATTTAHGPGGGQAIVFARYLKLTLAIAGGAAVALIVFGPWLVRLLFGAAFLPAASILLPLTAGAFFAAMKHVAYEGLKTKSRLAAITRAQAVTLVANVAGLAILFPLLGLPGVAWAYFLSHIGPAGLALAGVAKAFEKSPAFLLVPTRSDWEHLAKKLRPYYARR